MSIEEGRALDIMVSGYRLLLDRRYHADDHTWARQEGDVIRVGLDDLGQATTGDLAQIALRGVGERVRHGEELGTLEAQKYVGPLRSPICGEIVATNDVPVRSPRVVNEDPYGEGWLVLLRPTEHDDISGLVGPREAAAWFAAKADRFRREGVLAE
ncbi:MAG: glycine cleavage system protein H [Chloroflexota bacterium]